ncbi:MAG: acyltransferase family protein [Eubacteriales bacterium]|nr:acyltransferase family protein [Eubacteriales bacterium]
MFNHTGNAGFTLFTQRTGSLLFPFYLIISILDKMAVPLFFMVSGALLLGKEESIAAVFRKRVLRFGIILLAVSACYFARIWKMYDQSHLLRDFLVLVYSADIADHLWYLYSYLGLLFMLPLLRKMVKSMDTMDYLYFFLCHILLTGLLPMAEFYVGKGHLSLTGNFSVSLLKSSSIFFFVMGYFFERHLDSSAFSRKNILLGVLLSFIAVGITCYMTMFKAKLTGQTGVDIPMDYFSSLIAFPAFCVYGAVKRLFQSVKVSAKMRKIMTQIGSTTFGIYLLEGFLRSGTEFVYTSLEPVLTPLPAALLWIAAALAVGIVLVTILKKIPGIRYLV